MTSITIKQFRALTWKEVYNYGDTKKGFKVYGSSLEGVTIIHDFRKGSATKISYRVDKRNTDSPSQAVKWYNARQKAAAERSRTQIAGSAEPAAGSPA